MKFLMPFAMLIMSMNVFSNEDKCYESVVNYFENETTMYSDHYVSKKYDLVTPETTSIEDYGRTVELYDRETGLPFTGNVRVYHASNEYWSGYGAYVVIVDDTTCKNYFLKETYSE